VATLGYDEEALADLARIALFLANDDSAACVRTMDLIREAISILTLHPLIGRPAPRDYRELVVSQGATGYIALYGYSQAADHVQVHGIRHQREAGFDD
jgi:plasmid stabilization system protein ParE